MKYISKVEWGWLASRVTVKLKKKEGCEVHDAFKVWFQLLIVPKNILEEAKIADVISWYYQSLKKMWKWLHK